jgi:hypothetical protein
VNANRTLDLFLMKVFPGALDRAGGVPLKRAIEQASTEHEDGRESAEPAAKACPSPESGGHALNSSSGKPPMEWAHII